MGKKHRNRNNRRKPTPYSSPIAAQSSDTEETIDATPAVVNPYTTEATLTVKFPFTDKKATDSTGEKRNLSALSTDLSDISGTSGLHENVRIKMDSDTSLSDQSSLLLAMTTPVITFTTTTVSTSLASGSLPAVAYTGAATLAATPPAPSQLQGVASRANPTTAVSAAPLQSAAAPASVTPAAPAYVPPVSSTGTTTAGQQTGSGGAPSASRLNLSYDDLARALTQCLTRDDVSEILVSKLTTVVAGLTRTYEERHERDQAKIKELEKSLSDTKVQINDLEQYSRRNSVRITNNNWREHPFEDCERMVLDLAWDMGFKCEPWMIDRVHRTGRPGRQRDILVKFISYKFKDALLKARRDIGGDPNFRSVFINEDLTAETGKLFYKARALKKDKKLHSASTRDGRVMVARFSGDTVVRVKDEIELNNLAARGTYHNALTRNQPTEHINTRLLRVAGQLPQGHARSQAGPRQTPPPRSSAADVSSSNVSVPPRPVDTSSPNQPRVTPVTRRHSFSFETY